MFRSRVKEARLRAGMTPVEAAQALGKPQSFIAKCEAGERRLHCVELQESLDIRRVPLSFFEMQSMTCLLLLLAFTARQKRPTVGTYFPLTSKCVTRSRSARSIAHIQLTSTLASSIKHFSSLWRFS